MQPPVSIGLLEPFGIGLGDQDYLQPAAPAAGSNLAIIVESRNWVRVLAARATLTTDANAANRLFSLDFISARGLTYLRNQPPVVITASTTNQAFEWKEQLTGSEWNTNTPVNTPVSSVFLPPGTTIQFTVTAIQVGDAITAPSLLIERFETGPSGYPIGLQFETPETIKEALPSGRVGYKPASEITLPGTGRSG